MALYKIFHLADRCEPPLCIQYRGPKKDGAFEGKNYKQAFEKGANYISIEREKLIPFAERDKHVVPSRTHDVRSKGFTFKVTRQ